MTNLSHLKALLELARKQAHPKWRPHYRGKSMYMENLYPKEDARMFAVRGVGGVSDFEDWGFTKESATYIAAMSPDRIIPALEEAIAAMEARPRYPSEGVEL